MTLSEIFDYQGYPNLKVLLKKREYRTLPLNKIIWLSRFIMKSIKVKEKKLNRRVSRPFHKIQTIS